MSEPAIFLSRRRAVGLLVAAPAAACLGLRAAAQPDYESNLRLPGPPAQLDLLRLEWPEGGFGTDKDHVTAVVRMTWAPGTRQYRVTCADRANPAVLAAAIRARFAAITAGNRPERSA